MGVLAARLVLIERGTSFVRRVTSYRVTQRSRDRERSCTPSRWPNDRDGAVAAAFTAGHQGTRAICRFLVALNLLRFRLCELAELAGRDRILGRSRDSFDHVQHGAGGF